LDTSPRILFVDDDENIRTLFVRSYTREFGVVAAASGQEGIARLEERDGRIPLVVSDQRMPGMSGVQFLSVVRERWPETIRIIATAYDEPRDVIDAVNLGEIHRFIRKPWDREEMRVTLRRALETFDLRARNAKLTAELLHAERLATIGRLVSGIAHEVKNQLVVVALADAIQSRYADDRELKEMLDVLRGSLSLVGNLVEGIRDFALKRDDGKKKAPAAVRDVVESALSLLRCDKKFRRATLARDLDADLPPFPMHKDKLQQVLINLLRNAAQALPATGGRIEVRLRREGDAAVVVVRDEGCGMPPDVLARLGEPFFTTKGESGTGLGLGISREIVEGHGGTLNFESAPGAGTTATIRLPIAPGAAPPVPA